MEQLFEKQDALLNATNMGIVRNFINHVNWEAPMLCIRGPRGVGKSTLLRQYIRQQYGIGSEAALYCSLDFSYFTQHTILEVAEKFYKHGGKLLVLDEAHKYENWSREVKEVADILQISEEQVKVNIFRARQAIRQKYFETEKYGL